VESVDEFAAVHDDGATEIAGRGRPPIAVTPEQELEEDDEDHGAHHHVMTASVARPRTIAAHDVTLTADSRLSIGSTGV